MILPITCTSVSLGEWPLGADILIFSSLELTDWTWKKYGKLELNLRELLQQVLYKLQHFF